MIERGGSYVTTSELLHGRIAIKNELGALYDAFWSVCDTGAYFETQIPQAPVTRLGPRNLLLRSGTVSLRWAYRDVIERSAMSLAAETVAGTLQDAQLANHFRFVIRNREAADAVRAYLRFLDQVSYHFYEVSGRLMPTVKNSRGVSFAQLEKHLRKSLPTGSRRLLAAAGQIAVLAYMGMTFDERELLESFRNVDTHRFVVGIDHLTVWFRRRAAFGGSSGGALGLADSDPSGYALMGGPDLRYQLLERLLNVVMRNACSIVKELAGRRLLLDNPSAGAKN